MRLVATEYVSLDGVFEEPGQWSFDFWSDAAAQFKWRELQESDALLLGRKTYEGFAAAWPTMDAGEFGQKMNAMPKYVVTSTLTELSWSGSQVVNGDLESEIVRIKAEPGQDLLLAGSGLLFKSLSDAGLVDVYRMMVFPTVLGSGSRLFHEGTARTKLELTHHEVLDSGIAILEYRPS